MPKGKTLTPDLKQAVNQAIANALSDSTIAEGIIEHVADKHEIPDDCDALIDYVEDRLDLLLQALKKGN